MSDSILSRWMGIADAKLVSEMYAQSLLFTEYLVKKVGWSSVKDILVKSNGSMTFAAAFTEVVGKSVDDAEADWRGSR